MITYDNALSAAKSGNALFIIGAGFSLGALNMHDKRLLQGGELAKKIANVISFPDNFSLDVIVQQFIEEQGEFELLKLLKREFLVKIYDERYNSFAQLNKAHIYTTNYDNLVERIFEDNETSLKSYDIRDNCKKSSKGRFILHINGKISEDTEDIDAIRLSSSSYDKDFSKSPWIKYLVDDIGSVEAIFIIGHSLMGDLDIKRLISNYAEKCFIIQHPDIDDNSRKILSKYGSVCENGVFQFLQDLANATERTEVKEYDHLRLRAFRKIIREQVLTEPSDQTVFDFFIKGNNTKDVYYQDLNGNFVSLISRRYIKNAIAHLEAGKNLIIYSDLGNGKTIFFNQLVYKLPHKKFVMYERNMTSDYKKELRKLSTLDENIIVVFDVYNSSYEEVAYLKNYVGTKLQFILMARSAMHENYEKRIEEDLCEFDISEINLNHLNKEECKELDTILKRHGLWGKDSALSDERRMDILLTRCKASMQAIILYLFEASEIKKRFEEIIISEKSQNYKKLLILSFINSVLELKLSNDDFGILYPNLNIARIYRSELFEEFIYYDYDLGWTVKSPIIAKSMLNSNVFTKKEIVNILIELTLNLDELYDDYNIYNYALKNLGSCAYLSFIFNYDFDKSKLLDYFEAVKMAKFNKDNYFFWLQYAIACTNTKTYDRAEKYFNTSYSYAARRGKSFSTYQIDNHFARFLLDRQINSRNPKDAYSVFARAHQLLRKSKNDAKSESKYYEFRVARSYKDYYNIFYKHFSVDERRGFIESCNEVKVDLKAYASEIGKEHGVMRNDVFECKNNLEYILKNYQSFSE